MYIEVERRPLLIYTYKEIKMSKMNDKGLYPNEEIISNDGMYAVVVKCRDSKEWVLNTFGCGEGVLARMPYHGLLNGLHSRGVDNKTIRQHLRVVQVEEVPATERYLPCLPGRLMEDGINNLDKMVGIYYEGTNIPNYPAE
tara:strand:- start:418 stop:840 length:423 start_codon:yes stop_codon:yes gene_type:complete